MSSEAISRFKEIDGALGLHEIIASVRQLSFMKRHSQTLLDTLNVKLEITYARAPLRRQGDGQTYMLHRSARSKSAGVEERELEQMIWKQWKHDIFAGHRQPFVGGVCNFIQTYQMPLQGTRKDARWGKIDLVGATPGFLPVVMELKREGAQDTPLRMLVEGLAYACAVRKAWNEGGLRTEWATAQKQNGLHREPEQLLSEVPVILIAPTTRWKEAIGSPGKRTNGKVPDDAWPPFLELTQQCHAHGFPIHFVQFEIEKLFGRADAKIINVSSVQLPR